MILPIVAYGSNVLRSQCKEIDSSYSNLDQLIENMFETILIFGPEVSEKCPEHN